MDATPLSGGRSLSLIVTVWLIAAESAAPAGCCSVMTTVSSLSICRSSCTRSWTSAEVWPAGMIQLPALSA